MSFDYSYAILPLIFFQIISNIFRNFPMKKLEILKLVSFNHRKFLFSIIFNFKLILKFQHQKIKFILNMHFEERNNFISK